MGALIVQQLNDAVAVADQEKRLLPDPGSEEIAGVLHLAFMPDVDPCRTKDFLELESENVGIRVEAAMHPPWSNHGPDILCRKRGHRSRPCAERARNLLGTPILSHADASPKRAGEVPPATVAFHDPVIPANL